MSMCSIQLCVRNIASPVLLSTHIVLTMRTHFLLLWNVNVFHILKISIMKCSLMAHEIPSIYCQWSVLLRHCIMLDCFHHRLRLSDTLKVTLGGLVIDMMTCVLYNRKFSLTLIYDIFTAGRNSWQWNWGKKFSLGQNFYQLIKA